VQLFRCPFGNTAIINWQFFSVGHSFFDISSNWFYIEFLYYIYRLNLFTLLHKQRNKHKKAKYIQWTLIHIIGSLSFYAVMGDTAWLPVFPFLTHISIVYTLKRMVDGIYEYLISHCVLNIIRYIFEGLKITLLIMDRNRLFKGKY